MTFDTIWLDARLATLSPDRPGLGVIERGAIAARDGRIAFVGAMDDLPAGWDAHVRIPLDGRWVTPGLIDCHTHLVYAGDRAHEFELRLAGASYEEIARAGGGIVSTVKATRAASEDQLVAQSLPRLDALLADGVSTISTSRPGSCAPRAGSGASAMSMWLRPSSARTRCHPARPTRTSSSTRSSR
jgi:imidazolonepropionase